MNRNDQISLTEDFVKQNMKGYDSGHDWWHVDRVRRVALFINKMEELADPFIVEITALLHDTADSKFAQGNSELGYSLIDEFMENTEMEDIKEHVINVIKSVSFSSKHKSGLIDDHLLWVIQDADRLDALGAIGIARAFNYGGFRNNKIYDPKVINNGDPSSESGIQGTASTISHFYEKLLLLKYRMNTLTGKKLATDRHEFLEIFLKQFYPEWNFSFQSYKPE